MPGKEVKLNLYELVKRNVTAREAAEHYGLSVNRSGMCKCPFHPDRNPSMKVDRRYHCFGCGADGDVISLIAKLFNLSNREAAIKLAHDFDIPIKKQTWKGNSWTKRMQHFRKEQRAGNGQKRKKQKLEKIEELRSERFDKTEEIFYRILTDYYHLLKEWQEERAPKSPDEKWDDYFCEAALTRSKIEYLLDSFLSGDFEDRVDIINEYGEKVIEFEKRIQEFRSGEAEKAGSDD